VRRCWFNAAGQPVLITSIDADQSEIRWGASMASTSTAG
jgi:hypothetical protein